MNKKLLALLVVGAVAGQTAQAGVTDFFKAANALLNPLDLTRDKHEAKQKAKYAVAVHQDGQDNCPIVQNRNDNNKLGFLKNDGTFVEKDDLNTDRFVAVEASDFVFFVEKNSNNEPKRDDQNGLEIVTQAARDVSVVDQGQQKVAEFFDAEAAHKRDATQSGGKTSEAIWGFRQGVIGKWRANGLVAAGWVTVIGSYLLGRGMAQAEDDEDEDEEEDNA